MACGTTTLALARHLVDRVRVRVFTNSLDVAQLLAGGSVAEVTVAGGWLRPDYRALLGPLTLEAAGSHVFDAAFISVVAVDATRGFMDFGRDEASLRCLLARDAREVVMLADSAKFGRPAAIRTLYVRQVHRLVTDAPRRRPLLPNLKRPELKSSALKPTSAAIDVADLHAMMEAVSQLGGGPGGAMTRLTLSTEDRAARDWLAAVFAREGLALEVDGIGNMFGRLEWAGPDAPTVMTGSHLDSQPNGGRFDGAYGVVAACAALKAVKRAVAREGLRPRANLCIVNWTNEEGARFQPSLLGSGAYTGEIDLAWGLARTDGQGIAVGEALDHIGYRGDRAPPVPDAYLELHIEGSSKLEQAGLRFAAFHRFWGATKYRLAFVGRQAHTGPTPMAERQDALLAAAHLVVALKGLADRAGTELHTSVGRLEVSPNSPNVVPGEAVLFIELRSGAADVLAEAEAEMKQAIKAAAAAAGVGFEVRAVDRRRAGPMDAGLVRLAADVARDHGEDMLRLDTIAGHDGVSLAAVCPSLVMAVPSVGGVIHHPTEFTSAADRELGATILAGMLMRFCREGDPLRSLGV